MTTEYEDFDRGIDHLQWIATTLQGLRGAGALAHELIQNADDAADATTLTFRFERDHLSVIDNGHFESCGRVSEKTCPWETERRRQGGKKRCDFHAFRKLAGASKENAPHLTGAFGVGFLSVYQVTDRPELFSAGQHWIIDDANQRIRGCRGCETPHDRAGTTFRLAWADKLTPMREALSTDPCPSRQQQQLYRDFAREIPAAMVFLRKLESITIEHYSRAPVTFRREPTDEGVRVFGPAVDQHWLILEGHFDAEAAELRREHPQIKQRRSTVRLGLLPQGQVKGRLHATLPTEILTGLPVHVDASFFPRIDRKGIVLDGPEGEWNEAAIACAAHVLAANLELLAHALGAQKFWRIVRDAHAGRDRARRGAGESFHVFWARIRAQLADAVVMQTSRGEWRAVSETVLPGHKDHEDWAELLEDLNIPTVDKPLRPVVAAMRGAIPLATLTLDRLLDGLEQVGLNRGPFTHGQLPVGLGEIKRRNMLRRTLAKLLAESSSPSATPRLVALALWRTTERSYASLAQSWLANADTIEVFGHVISEYLIKLESQDSACRPLLDLGDCWGVDEAIETLAETEGALPDSGEQARKVLGWLDSQLDQLDQAQRATLRNLAILPTSQGLATPSVSVIPGGFVDRLKATKEVQPDIVETYPRLLNALGVSVLSFADFIKHHVPAGLGSGEPVQSTALLALLEACAEHRRVLDEDAGVRSTLMRLAWVFCSDQYRRTPGVVYFDTEIVRSVLGEAPKVNAKVPFEGAQADLLRAVGVRDVPRPADIVKHVGKLAAEPPTQARADAILQVLEYLQRDLLAIDSEPLCQLKALRWLPASDGKAWAAPQNVFFTRDRALFQHTGTFLSLSRKRQDDLRPALAALGVRQQPPVELVVNNVIEHVRRGEAVEARIAGWLDSDRHWADESVPQLRDVAWLPATDGSTRAPAELFRREHDLMPYLPVLAENIRGHVNLLDRLDIAVEPSAADALALLQELAHEAGDEPPDQARRKGIRACWRTLARDVQFDLSPLAGKRVVIGGDNRLYAEDEVLVNDLPTVAAAFDEKTQARFIKQSDTEAALRRLGVRALSEVARSRVVDTGPASDGARVAERIARRVPQLARIVKREGGEWSDVLRFAGTLTVSAYEWVTVERYLHGFAGIAATRPENLAAHYFGNGELVVAIVGSRPDWFEIAQHLRDILCPDASPAVTAAIERALGAETNLDAGQRLSKLGYAELDQEDWDELQRVLEEHRQREHAEAARRAAEAAEPELEEHEIDEPDLDDKAVSPRDQHPAPDTDTRSGPDANAGRERRDDDDGADGLGAPASPGDGSSDAGAGTQQPPPRAPKARHSGGRGAAGHSIGSGAHANGKNAHGGRSSGKSSIGNAGRGAGKSNTAAGGAKQNGSAASGAPKPSRSSLQPERQEHECWHAIASSSNTSEGRGDEGQREAARRSAIDKAGMKLVKRHEQASGRYPLDPDVPNNPGFDLYSCDEDGEVLRYIEVKSLSGAWGDGTSYPKPTHRQWEEARIERERWWLYVVEHAETEHSVITRIQDPWGRTTRYVLDPGWRSLGEEGPDLIDEDDDLELDDAPWTGG